MTNSFDFSDIIRQHLDNVKNYMIFQMSAYERNASNKHVNSLQEEVTWGSGALFGLWSWNVMETGRGGALSQPSRPKFPYDFKSIIKKWIVDKGIEVRAIPYKTDRPHKYTPEERGLNTMAYLISRKIMLHGTALHRSGVREDIYSSIINLECEAIAKESSLRIETTIANLNKSL